LNLASFTHVNLIICSVSEYGGAFKETLADATAGLPATARQMNIHLLPAGSGSVYCIAVWNFTAAYTAVPKVPIYKHQLQHVHNDTNPYQFKVMTVLRRTVRNPDREDDPGVDMQHVEHVSLCWCHLSPVPSASRPTLLRAHRTSSWCVSMNSTSLCTVYDQLHQHHPNTVNQSIILIQEKPIKHMNKRLLYDTAGWWQWHIESILACRQCPCMAPLS